MTTDDLQSNYQGVFDQKTGFGRRAALLIIDFVNAYIEKSSPFYAPGVVDAVQETKPLLKAARAARVPTIFTRNVFHPGAPDGGLFVRKVPALKIMQEDEAMGQIVESLAPGPEEIVLRKQYPSAFFGTSLTSLLSSQGIDTVVLAGCTTSGCVRATAVDTVSYGYRLVVARQCVGDRHPAPHEANLFDIHSKYGDVVDVAEIFAHFSAQTAASPWIE